MKVPGIEEVMETFWERCGDHFQRGCAQDGVLAVFETHVKGMLAEAFECGADCQLGNTGRVSLTAYGRTYAEDRISELKDPRHD